jgi:tRNA(Leu) C34 or U34 (ribose-2'-O)-methylase TrmL
MWKAKKLQVSHQAQIRHLNLFVSVAAVFGEMLSQAKQAL